MTDIATPEGMTPIWQEVVAARVATDEAHGRLEALKRENAPKFAAIRARREDLRWQRHFCIHMVIICHAVPLLLGALVALLITA